MSVQQRREHEAMSATTLSASSVTAGSCASSRTLSSERTARDLDFTGDSTMSPIDLEAQIQTNRLTSILDELIYKSKIVISLPHLIGEYVTLKSILSDEHMDDLLVIFEEYESPSYTNTSLLNMAALDDIKSGDLNLRNRLSPELSHLVYILSKYPALRQRIEEVIRDLKTECSKPCAEIPVNMMYLDTLEQFRGLMVQQLEMSAAVELENKRRNKNLIISNQRLQTKINDLEKTIKEEQKIFLKDVESKRITIAKLEKELSILTYECNMEIKKKVLDSERQMVLMSRAHSVRSELLREEENDTCTQYHYQLQQNLAEEKRTRARRFKVQTQLTSWLQKYDNEMGDKQSELDDLVKNFEEECEKVRDLEAKLAEQDIEYIPLMEEREKEYHEEMTLKMNTFLREHAARVIQFAWRTVLANRAEKRRPKGKGKKGGTKKK